MQLSKDKFAALCGVSSATICAVCKPDGHISINSAEKIAKGLNAPVQKLFELHLDTGGLSDKTILHYHIQIILVDGSTQTVPNDRLFTKVDSTPMNPYSVSDWVRKFVKRNNLPYFTPHSLRHTHATLLIAEGVSIPTVSRRLGHSSIATTSKIYIHAIQSADEIASNALEDKLKLERLKEDESI